MLIQLPPRKGGKKAFEFILQSTNIVVFLKQSVNEHRVSQCVKKNEKIKKQKVHERIQERPLTILNASWIFFLCQYF